MERWDKARVRQTSVKRTKYRPVGPIGEKQNCATPQMRYRAYVHTSLWLEPTEISTCTRCGYHVCSCKPQFMREESPFQIAGMNSVARGESLNTDSANKPPSLVCWQHVNGRRFHTDGCGTDNRRCPLAGM